MAKRSPILGFNHNFRHRGLIFHVQTEDSGVNNPHIFTHLFNGGVILSTRKLTYDVGAAEEVVKALMQAQHKAMLKSLKRGDFDPKITDYFGNDPKLDGGNTIPEPTEPTEPSTNVPGLGELELDLGDIEVVDADTDGTDGNDYNNNDNNDNNDDDDDDARSITTEIEVVDSVTRTDPSGTGERIADSDEDVEVIQADQIQPLGAADNPFENLELSSMDLSGDPMDTLRGPAPPGPIGETPSGAVVIHAAAPESAPLPPGAQPTRPGQYAQHATAKLRKLESGPIATPPTPAPPVVAPNPPAGKQAFEARRPRTETRPFQSEPDNLRAKPAATSESQSVIVSAPPTVIGSPAAAKEQPSKTQPTRRAKEQPSGGSLFGKDLISEKSLDEVILAYLSEDGADRE